MQYYKIFTDRFGAHYIGAIRPNGSKRRISETQKAYQAWLAEGNTPIEIPYVSPSLVDYKIEAKTNISSMAFTKRAELIPDYKMTNANMVHPVTGERIYPDALIIRYFDTVEAFRDEFYRLRDAINACADYDAVDVVVANENYPTEILP